MKTGRLALALALAAAGSAMGCDGSVRNEPEVAPSADALDEDAARQPLERTLLAESGYQVISLRTTIPITEFKTDEDFENQKTTLVGYCDCFNVQKIPDTGHIYEKCIATSLAEQTMTPLKETDLGVRVSFVAGMKP
jgi:hypothetical protein